MDASAAPLPAWNPVDPLGETLHFLHMDGAFYSRCEFAAPWGLALPRMEGCLMFHVVTSGRCWLEVDDSEPAVLEAGDLVLLPHGEGHRLVSQPGQPTRDLFALPREVQGERYERLRLDGGGAPCSMVCGAVRFEHPAARRLVRSLPAVMTVQAARSLRAEWMHSTLGLMAQEAREMRPGGEAVLTRLADILVIQAIRQWLDQAPAARTGWLGALQDRQIGRAIAAIHRDPAHPWTVASLAAVAAVSRSAFAARFTERVGMPVLQYVTQWRMHLALDWLRARQGESLAQLAARAGYQSEAAFSRAFKRINGVSPGAAQRLTGD
ncbi:MAG: AraC family transcriptional regulator [Proteobacteria bacterium]|nr:AraC family transcriptional regulator [Pseudomonadota bacterium]